MLKTKAIELLGGSVASAAKEIGVSYQAVDKWPTELPPRIADRVLAAVARKRWPDLTEGTPPADEQHATGATDRRARAERRQSPRRSAERSEPSKDKPCNRKDR